MFRVGASLGLLGVLVVGCAGAPLTQPAVATETLIARASELPEASSPLVGTWRGQHECEGIVTALAGAGFDESVIIENLVGNGVLPAGAANGELMEACADGRVLEHSHQFTADGQFFSYDQDGEEVDFGTWELVDDDTIRIGAPDRGGVTFDFTTDGDQLTLRPDTEPRCISFECQWAVMVAMPWTTMERVE